jgi:hypothetical protein
VSGYRRGRYKRVPELSGPFYISPCLFFCSVDVQRHTLRITAGKANIKTRATAQMKSDEVFGRGWQKNFFGKIF